MTDLNEWRLEYGDTELDFGTLSTGHPLTRQVDVSEVTVDLADLVHPLSDGLTFGEDRARGMRLTFAGAHLSTLPQPRYRRWDGPMDDAQVFERAWRAREVRRKAGSVARLSNLDRGFLVYGRPRGYKPELAVARQGWVEYACAFDTVDDHFYSMVEQVVVAGTEAGSANLFAFPLTFPYATVAPSETRAWVVNGGTDDTWPIITFRRGGNPLLELLDADGGTVWTLKVPDALAYDDEVVVDTRPWKRTVERNGSDAPGLVRGTRLADVTIPPGAHELRLTANDPSGLAEVECRWRDAFGAL